MLPKPSSPADYSLRFWSRLFVCLIAVGTMFGASTQARSATPDVAAQSLSQLRTETWQTEQGLPLNTVQAVYQSQVGHLWVGTAGGLARFDGVRFTTFETPAVPELTSRAIFAFFEDSAGHLWIGNHTGAARYANGTFERVFAEEVTDRRRVWAFAEGPRGTVWAATENGLVRWEQGKGVVKVYKTSDGLPTNRLRTVAFDAAGTLWIATTGGGLVAKRGEHFRTYGVADGLPHKEVRHALPAPDGSVWATTPGGGLARLKEGAFKVLTTADGLPSNHLTALALDRHGALWIGSWGAGIARYKDGRFDTLNASGGLAGEQIWSLHVDREDSIWVGTWVGGMNRLRARDFAVIGKPEGLSHDNTRSVLRGRDGVMWVATAGGGVNRVARDGITPIGPREGLPSGETASLFEDTDGTLWIGTYTEGLVRWSDGKLTRYTLAHGLPGNDVRAITRDRDGVLWVGTASGLARQVGERFEPVRAADVPTEGITSLAPAPDGTLWIGSTGAGVVGLRGGTTIPVGRAQGLLSNWVLALHLDSDGALVIGTGGEGLSRFANGKVTNIRTADGLWDSTVQTIVDDGRGHYWCTSNRGFFRIAKSEIARFAAGETQRVNSVGFGPGDALRSTTFAGALQPAGALDHQGRLWLPSFNSVVIVDPTRLPGSAQPPKVSVDEILLAGNVMRVTDTLLVPPGNIPITLRYFANSLRDANRVRFRYRMEGLTNDWVNLGSARETSFPTLPHGTYELRLAASLDGVRWSDPEATLNIIVAPRFYKTRWFVVAAGAVALAVLYALYLARTRRLRKQHAEMEALVAEKTEALRQANLHLLRLSQSDALTGLANRRRLDEVLDMEWRRAQRTRTSLALVMIDIDFFKLLNDSLGHPEGDRCLAILGDLIAQVVNRPGDCAGRYGGEEFLVVLPDTPREGAALFAERIRKACEARALRHPASPVSGVVTVSLGVAAMVPDASATAAALLAQADAALYRAKEAGRNRVM